MNFEAQITTPIYPTEVEDRVERAVTTLFPEADVEHADGELRAESASLEHFADRLAEQAIGATAREVFLEGIRGRSFSFRVKKQAALGDVVNFVVGDSEELGSITVHVTVTEGEPEAVIEELVTAEE